MNKFVITCCLLVVTVAFASAKSYHYKKRDFQREVVQKLGLHRSNTATNLKRLLKRENEEGEYICKPLAPCFVSFGKDVADLYKSGSGTLTKCRALVDDAMECVQDKVDDRSVCKDCSEEALGGAFWALEAAGDIKKLVCSGFMPGVETCTQKMGECVGECAKEEEERDDKKCRQCLKDLESDIKSNHKCPLLIILKEIVFTYKVLDPFIEAISNGCDGEKMSKCEKSFKNVKCSSDSEVGDVQRAGLECLGKMVKDDDKCEALDEVEDIYEEEEDKFLKMGEMACKVEHQVDDIDCSANQLASKKELLVNLLKKYLHQ